MEFAFLISKDLLAVDKAGKFHLPYRSKLEHEGDCTIEIVEDNSITTPALIEFAENYNREMHIVRHKSDYPLVEHLIMHELVHLDLVIQARMESKNRIFISNQSHKREFLQDYDSAVTKLQKLGINRDRIDLFLSSLFDGLNKQIYNAPIDLFIENYLHDEYPELRPYQFASLLHLQNEAIKAVTDKQVVEHSPKDVISKSKILNIVGALQLKDLYGIDLIKQYKAEHYEMNLAKEFYREFLENKDNKQVAVEYDMVQKWAEKLKIDSYFELIDEVNYRTKRIDLDNILKSIENDPYDMESDQPFKESEMSKFQQSQDELGTNMAVVMFMVDALQYFDNKPKEEIKKIALEIAMIGTQGISPAKDNYIISSINGKKFSGYHLLAYYYVSWAIAIPEMLENLEMPYDREYQMALKIHNPI